MTPEVTVQEVRKYFGLINRKQGVPLVIEPNGRISSPILPADVEVQIQGDEAVLMRGNVTLARLGRDNRAHGLFLEATRTYRTILQFRIS